MLAGTSVLKTICPDVSDHFFKTFSKFLNEREILARHGAPTAVALAESALYHASLLERCDFEDVVISVKSSDVHTMIGANRLLAKQTEYPLHLGVTEAGGEQMGSIKGAIGIGTLLADGIGDTVRVSLTADPVAEIAAARRILGALHVEGQCGLDVVSCPTCGRTKVDLISLAERFEKAAGMHPYTCEIESERELIAYAQRLAECFGG